MMTESTKSLAIIYIFNSRGRQTTKDLYQPIWQMPTFPKTTLGFVRHSHNLLFFTIFSLLPLLSSVTIYQSILSSDMKEIYKSFIISYLNSKYVSYENYILNPNKYMNKYIILYPKELVLYNLVENSNKNHCNYTEESVWMPFRTTKKVFIEKCFYEK